jgi:hypothetical protein
LWILEKKETSSEKWIIYSVWHILMTNIYKHKWDYLRASTFLIWFIKYSVTTLWRSLKNLFYKSCRIRQYHCNMRVWYFSTCNAQYWRHTMLQEWRHGCISSLPSQKYPWRHRPIRNSLLLRGTEEPRNWGMNVSLMPHLFYKV